jgi:hypothetical protein
VLSGKRAWALAAAVGGATAVIALVLLEARGSLRAASWLEDVLGRPEMAVYIVPDETLGWRPAPNRAIELERAGGRLYRSDARGWRRFEAEGEPPLVVIGDSFTQAEGVPDGELWDDRLARELALPIVALGVNGYGTTQEWMLARDMRPELPRVRALLLQLHDNDVLNNSCELERRSWLNNNMMPRPYLSADGELEWDDPRRLLEHLALGRELSRRGLTERPPTVEALIEGNDPAVDELYATALRSTALSLARLRALFAEVPAYAFNACPVQKRIGGDLERLAAEAGFEILKIHPELDRRGAGSSITLEDGSHWNERGHAIVGELLLEQLGDALR